MPEDHVRGRIWFERDYPVLLATAKLLEDSPYSQARSQDVADETGLAQDEVVKALKHLEQKFVVLSDISTLARRDYLATGLTADGLVAADVWPSSDTVAERLIEALERALDEAPEGSTKQKRIRAVLDGVRDLGIGGAGNVLGQAISYALGLAS